MALRRRGDVANGVFAGVKGGPGPGTYTSYVKGACPKKMRENLTEIGNRFRKVCGDDHHILQEIFLVTPEIPGPSARLCVYQKTRSTGDGREYLWRR